MFVITCADLLPHHIFICYIFVSSTNSICLHSDIAPEGETLEETNRNLDEISDLALELQKKHDVKLLWGTANLFANPRQVISHVCREITLNVHHLGLLG